MPLQLILDILMEDTEMGRYAAAMLTAVVLVVKD
jgi:hypothetical protein